MTVNAGPEYFVAEKRYLNAKTMEEKILYLEEMIRAAPKHKSSEKFVAELKKRLIRLRERHEKQEKSRKSSGKKGIKKEGFQIALLGLPNSGKSSLLSKLTNAKPLIASNPFNTTKPTIGTLNHQGIKAQIVDLPSIGSDFFDVGIINTANLVLIVIESLSDLEKINPFLSKANGKKLIALNKSDLLNQEQLRKLNETIKSKKLSAIVISCLSNENIELLMFREMEVVRVYTKEPGKPPTKDPVILPTDSTVKDIAESIRKGFSLLVKESRVTGPSSRFPNQKTGLDHKLKDLDIVEFHIK